MIVTDIEPITSARYRVYIDGEFAFVLYKGEFSKYQIKKDEEVSPDVLLEIKNVVLVKRAKLRAMHLLNVMPRTEQQLREKLMQSEYPEDVIEAALKYVKSFGYINDEAYIKNFILGKMGSKSRREIQMLLKQKGLSGEYVNLLMNEAYGKESEVETIQEIMRKKRWNSEEMDRKQKEKMYSYLVRKGFHYEDIRKAERGTDF